MSEIAFDAGGYLIDLDGTLISGRLVLPDARWLLKQVEDHYMVVSNNAEHTPDQLSRMLRSLGLPLASDRIILAGTTAIDCIAQRHPGASVLLLGSAGLRNYARRKGLRLHQERPDIVLVTRDRNFSYIKIATAAEALCDGAALFVAAPDLSHPGPTGKPVPETGALAAAILACAGPREYTVIGKPERILFEMACKRLGVTPADAVMIGDNPQTDGLGASRVGMQFWQVDNGLLRRPMRQAAE
ncbi:HAD-IIA family hydrolase [Agrobacterium rosae]|uniref:HAD-IIA family hydrolase n=1 Tax=Agrobacterium rosae TaxID=1972867 RepID=UPI003BA28A18